MRFIKPLLLGAISWAVLVWVGDHYLAVSEPKSMAKKVMVYGLQTYYPVAFLICAFVSVVVGRYRRR